MSSTTDPIDLSQTLLGRVADEMDSLADQPFTEVCQKADLNPEVVQELAFDRALLLVLAREGIMAEDDVAQLDERQRRDLIHLSASWADGVLIGWRAGRIRAVDQALLSEQ